MCNSCFPGHIKLPNSPGWLFLQGVTDVAGWNWMTRVTCMPSSQPQTCVGQLFQEESQTKFCNDDAVSYRRSEWVGWLCYMSWKTQFGRHCVISCVSWATYFRVWSTFPYTKLNRVKSWGHIHSHKSNSKQQALSHWNVSIYAIRTEETTVKISQSHRRERLSERNTIWLAWVLKHTMRRAVDFCVMSHLSCSPDTCRQWRK